MMEMEDVRRLMAEGRMLRSEERNGRDTTMCGDPKSWFPMRVTYQREMKVKGYGSFWGLREGRTNWLAVHG